jgi:hypothetical protein
VKYVVFTYFVLGLLLVALGSLTWRPLQGETPRERAVWAVEQILTWPRMVTDVAGALDLRSW